MAESNNDILKYGLILGGGGLAAYGIYKLATLKDTADKLSVYVSDFRAERKGTEFLEVLLELKFNNPTKEEISLQINALKAFYNGKEIGHKAPEEKKPQEEGGTDKGEETQTEENTVISSSDVIPYKIRVRFPYQSLIFSRLVFNAVNLLTLSQAAIEEFIKKLTFKIFLTLNGAELDTEAKFGEEAQQVGLVAAGRRNIKDGSKYDYLFPDPTGLNVRVQNNASVEDTVKWCGFVVQKYHKDTEKLANFLNNKSNTKKELFKNIFDFCYNHIQYHLDTPGTEQLRRPAQTWKDRVHGVDCDDFTMFIASVLHNLRTPFEFRITKYDYKPNYQHIYLIVPADNGKHITIDPVLDTFNYEKPFTAKKDFDMESLNLAGATSEGMGIPIAILAGTPMGSPNPDILKIMTGEDLYPTINGLGSIEDDGQAMLRYLKRLRNVYVQNPDYIADFQDPKQAVQMLDDAIKYWNTPKRQAVLDKLAETEDRLIARGEIMLPEEISGFDDFDDDEDWEEDYSFSGAEQEQPGYDYKYFEDGDWEEDIEFSGTEPELAGYEYRYEEPEWEEDYEFSGVETEEPEFEYDYSIDGLDGRRRRRRKARRKARRAKRKARRRERKKKKGGLFKRVARFAKKGVKKGVNLAKKTVKFAARAVVKIGAAPARLAFLTAMRTNVGKIADKLKYAYLTEHQATARGIDVGEFRKLKRVHSKVENIFGRMGGNKNALKKAILSGKRKNLRGFENLGSGISGINGFDGFEEDLGYTGREPENPQYEYKYDNQVWSVDDDFSGTEPEGPNYEYDYSFNGLDGRKIRFCKRIRAKKRYRRRKRRLKKILRRPELQKMFAEIRQELKVVDGSKLVKRKESKRAFLMAFAYNHHHISTLLSYAYISQAGAQKDGISPEGHTKIKHALKTAKQLFQAHFGGNEKQLKKAIELGKNKPNLEGLGAAVAAAGAATGIIGQIVKWIKDIRLKKKAKKGAKAAYKADGGTNQQWRQQGKQRFNSQWAEQSMRLPQTETQAEASPPSPPTDFTDIINKNIQSRVAPPGLPEPSPAVPQQNVPGAEAPPAGEEKGFKKFWGEHKKKILTGGGVALAGAIGFGIYKHVQNQKEEEKKALAQKNKANSADNTKNLSGAGNSRKSPAKKTPQKITKVTLR